jgi:hypothetical protein
MTTTVYYAGTAGRQLAEAQRVLDAHVTSSVSGRCLACGEFGPCPAREGAVVVFARSLCLPRRRPGATRSELVVSGRQYARRW